MHPPTPLKAAARSSAGRWQAGADHLNLLPCMPPCSPPCLLACPTPHTHCSSSVVKLAGELEQQRHRHLLPCMPPCSTPSFLGGACTIHPKLLQQQRSQAGWRAGTTAPPPPATLHATTQPAMQHALHAPLLTPTAAAAESSWLASWNSAISASYAKQPAMQHALHTPLLTPTAAAAESSWLASWNSAISACTLHASASMTRSVKSGRLQFRCHCTRRSVHT